MSILSYVLYPLIVFAMFVVGLIPPRVGRVLAWVVGSIVYFLMPSRRRVMATNYAPVLDLPPSDSRVQRVGRLAFRNFFRYLYEFLSLSRRSVEEIDSRVRLHISDHFVQACAQGKGMIYVSAHFGNMDYAGIAAVRHLLPMTIVADVIKPMKLMNRIVKVRGDKGLKLVYLTRAPKAILVALKNNEAVGFLLDVGCSREGGIPVTFFGRRTTFPAGPALLSLRTGAPIVVGYSLVVGDRVEVYSYPPIYAVTTGNKEQDTRRCSQLIAANFEDFLRRYPEQWYIFRPMWGPQASAESSTANAEESAGSTPVTEGA